MTCLKQRFLWILPDYARFTQNMKNMPNYAKNILAKKAITFLPKEWKLCPIFKIWQKLCQNGSAGLSSHNLKTASDVLYDKSHVTIVHSQCHKKRILIVIHLNPLRRTVFHIFSEVQYTHSSAECFVNNDMAKNLSWTNTNSLHISVLETLTGTPYRQRLFYRNGVPGRSGLLSPLLMTPFRKFPVRHMKGSCVCTIENHNN